MDEAVANKLAKLPTLTFSSHRRIGIEIELNASDGLARPANRDDSPAGIDNIMELVAANVEEGVTKTKYMHTENNPTWVVKPDASCGIEIVSPPMKGLVGVEKTVRLVHMLSKSGEVTADRRCSFHIHVELDLPKPLIAAVVAWWLKCEAVFMDAMPATRQRNKYCQLIGLLPLFHVNKNYTPGEMIELTGSVKYLSFNTFMMVESDFARKTCEFRVGENDMCTNPLFIKNWIRLILHFVEMAVTRGMPDPYVKGNKWTSVCWLDPKDVFSFLGFWDEVPKYQLSNGLRQVRDWFLARLLAHQPKHVVKNLPRSVAFSEVLALAKAISAENGSNFDMNRVLYPPDLEYQLYDQSLRY